MALLRTLGLESVDVMLYEIPISPSKPRWGETITHLPHNPQFGGRGSGGEKRE